MATAPGNRLWQANVGLVQLAMLRLTPATGDQNGKLAQLDVLVRQFSSLTEIDPKNATWAKHQAQVLVQTAAVQLDAGRVAAALGSLNLAHERLQARVMLATALLVRADIALKVND